MTGRPAVIVLAAGKGSRFLGECHKLAQPLGGHTVLGHTLRHALASQLPVVVVTTEALAEVARGIVAARDVIVVPEVGTPGQAGLGMGHSIAAGVAARPNAPGWLMLPPRCRPWHASSASTRSCTPSTRAAAATRWALRASCTRSWSDCSATRGPAG